MKCDFLEYKIVLIFYFINKVAKLLLINFGRLHNAQSLINCNLFIFVTLYFLHIHTKLVAFSGFYIPVVTLKGTC